MNAATNIDISETVLPRTDWYRHSRRTGEGSTLEDVTYGTEARLCAADLQI